MSRIMTAHANILESSGVTLISGGASPDTPLSRLYDRNLGRPMIAASAETLTVRIDQGSNPLSVDRLIIPEGHNLSGAILTLTHSDDDIDYTPAVTAWQAASGLVNVSWESVTKRYWKFTIAGASAPPELAELFITSTYTWHHNPQRPTGPMSPEFNIKKVRSSGGQERHMVMGPALRRRSYGLVRMNSAMLAEMRALESAWQGANPFWLADHESQWIWGTLDGGLAISETAGGLWRMRFEFIEVTR